MSARRKPRFEVVRSDAGWFARFVGANGRKVWQTEVYTQRKHPLNAIALVAGGQPSDVGHGGEVPVWGFVDPDGLLEVREVDERTPAREPVVPTLPLYVGSTVDGGRFWHDADYHWRMCLEDHCHEGTPEPGTEVRTRFGMAVV